MLSSCEFWHFVKTTSRPTSAPNGFIDIYIQQQQQYRKKHKNRTIILCLFCCMFSCTLLFRILGNEFPFCLRFSLCLLPFLHWYRPSRGWLMTPSMWQCRESNFILAAIATPPPAGVIGYSGFKATLGFALGDEEEDSPHVICVSFITPCQEWCKVSLLKQRFYLNTIQ